MASPISEFVENRAGNGISPRRVAELLHVSMQGLALLARTQRNTLSRTPDTPKAQAALSEIVRVLITASQVMGGDASPARAVMWFKSQPLSGFEKTAMELVRDGRAEAVLAHLAMLEDGGYA